MTVIKGLGNNSLAHMTNNFGLILIKAAKSIYNCFCQCISPQQFKCLGSFVL